MADLEGGDPCEDIVLVSAIELIRRRPQMYVGDVWDGSGQHFLVMMLVERLVEGHAAGRESRADLHLDGSRVSMTVSGQALELDAASGFEAELTRYTLQDVTFPAVTALSRHLQVDVSVAGRSYRQHFARGKALGPAAVTGEDEGEQMRFEFELDDELFRLRPWQLSRLTSHCQELLRGAPSLSFAIQGHLLGRG